MASPRNSRPGGRRPDRPGRRPSGSATRGRATTYDGGPETQALPRVGPTVRPWMAARQVGAAVAGQRRRVTGRAVVLMLICLVLAMSFASSLKAYVHQRGQIQALKTEIAERQAAIADLQREKERWEDPAFIEQQARARFGYVNPGEQAYLVLGADGKPLQPDAELADPDQVIRVEPTAWWEKAWGSVQLAGHPPKAKPQEQTVPADLIEAPEEPDQ